MGGIWSQLSGSDIFYIKKEHLSLWFLNENTRKTTALLISSGVVLAAVLAYFRLRKRLPPGPMGLPFIGAALKFNNDVPMHIQCINLTETYGDLISFKLGGQLWVVLHGYDLIEEAMVTRGADFADRPKNALTEITGFKDEIFALDHGDTWKQNRKFALQAFRSFGPVSHALEQKIEKVIDEMVYFFNQKEGSPVDIQLYVQRMLAKVITSVIYSSEYDLEDPKLDNLADMVRNLLRQSFNEEVETAFRLPQWLAKLIFHKAINRAKDSLKDIKLFLKEHIDQHKETIDGNNLRDVLDVILNDKTVTENWNEDSVACTLAVFMINAIDTISSHVLWALLYIIRNPQIQKRIHEELDSVVGRSNRPSVTHRPRLTYLEATIQETFRITSSSPLSCVQQAQKDTTLRGYDIPRSAFIFQNLYGVHMNPKLFPNPTEFNPNRFLSDEGKLTNTKCVIPFAIGRRKCMGDQITKIKLFLVLANLFHRFSFSFPSDEPDPPLEGGMYGYHLRIPKPYKVCAHPRT